MRGPRFPAIEGRHQIIRRGNYRRRLSIALGGEAIEPVADATSGLSESLHHQGLIEPVLDTDRIVAYHGQCHQHAAGTDSFASAVLASAWYEIATLQSGCCGMAGSLGYEAEHYVLSPTIASDRYDRIDRADPAVVAAPGVSCHLQVREWADAPTRAPCIGARERAYHVTNGFTVPRR